MLITAAGLDFEQGSFNQLSINATLAISFLYLQRNPGTIVLISIACFRLTLYCTFHRDQKPPAIQTFNVQERLRLECGEAGSKGNHEWRSSISRQRIELRRPTVSLVSVQTTY